MCGIVGAISKHQVAPLLVEALRRLEYRGYDSAGIATLNRDQLDRRRATGKLVNLSDMLVHNPLAGTTGIGHTRWATHGTATVENAHPHSAAHVSVVHNGIIENYKELRAELASLGHSCTTDTDTETVVHLAQHHLNQGMDPVAAVDATLARLEGAFALLFLFEGHADLLIAARKGSPMAIGLGEGEMFVGSDAIALGPLTSDIIYLEEGDRAVITLAGADIVDASGAAVTRPVTRVSIDHSQIDKQGHKHFMAKEIAEQPSVIAGTLAHYLDADHSPLDGIDFTQIDHLTMVACGTAFYAAMTAKYWFETIARIPVEIDIASEFRYRAPPMRAGSAALFVSQSGETADTLAALRYAAGEGAQILSVVNVPTSSIARESAVALPIHAGVEVGVASTKAFTCQLTVLLLAAIKAAMQRGQITAAEAAEMHAELRKLPGLMNSAIGNEAGIKKLSRKLSEASDILFLGRGLMYPLAHEGALKLKEISYIHAEAYAAGELKHGPIALVDEHVPIILMAPRDALFGKTISNMQEVIARGGRVVLISDASGCAAAGSDAWAQIELPAAPDFLTPILYAIPAQLIAYHTAVEKGTDVDQPRNLAKSVTVE